MSQFENSKTNTIAIDYFPELSTQSALMIYLISPNKYYGIFEQQIRIISILSIKIIRIVI